MNKMKKFLLVLPLAALLFGCKRINQGKTKDNTTITNNDITTTKDDIVDDTNYYIINYELNGGKNNELNPSSFVEGNKVKLYEATKEGYDFVGWSTNENGTSFIDEIDLDIDWKIYAIFTPHKYTINYHNLPNNSINSNPDKYTITDSNITLTKINDSNIDFKGWYTTSTYDDDSLIEVIKTNSLKNYDLYAKYEIIKKMPECVILANNPTYNGNEQQLLSASVTGGTITYSLDGINYSDEIPTATNAGNYKVYYKVTGDELHFDIEDSIDVTINKATYTLENITFNNASKVYNGEAQSLVINGDLPAGVSVSYEGSGTNVGEYEITANFTIDDTNYEISPKKATLTITKATYSGIEFNNGSKVYNGSAQQLEVTSLPEGLTVEYSGFGINVGSYEITAIFTNNDENYFDVDPITRTLTITKATYTLNVTFSDNTFEYDGLYHDLAIDGTLPDGLTVSYENNHKKDVNDYTVIAVFNNANPNYFDVDSLTAHLVITPTSATYTLPTGISGLKYSGNELLLINPGTVTDGYFEYKYGSLEWSTNVPKATNSGSYNVEYRLVLSGNYEEVSGGVIVVTIAKATYDLSNVKFNDATKVYNGSNQTIDTITGNLPTGVTVSYEGFGKNVGSYEITAKFSGDSSNYELIPNMTATLTITNATMTNILVEGYNGKADDELHQAVVSYKANTVDNSEITWSFSSDGVHFVDASDLLVSIPTDSGTYYYKATAANHEAVTGSFTVVVSDKDTPTLEITNLASLNKTYDGYSITTPVITTNSNGSYEVTYSTDKATYTSEKPINAGHYYVKVVLEETSSYAGKTIEGSFDIAKDDYELDIEFKNKTVKYNGSEQGIVIVGDLPEGVTVRYTGYATNAGKYTITATFNHSNPNYNEINNITAELTIEKADYELNVEFNDNTVTYNGEIQRLEITGTLPEGVTVVYENNNNKNVGTYTVTAIFSGDLINHNKIESITAILTIEKANYDLSNISFEDTSKVYNGLTQTITIEGNLPDTLAVSYTGGGVNVGTYQVTAAFTNSDSNYNDVESITRTLTITKNAYDMSGVSLNDKVVDYNENEQGIVITGTLPEGVTVSYSGYATNAGVHTVTASFKGDSTNYELIPDMTAKLTINKIDPEFTTPTNLVAKYGSTLASVVLPEGFIFNDPLNTSVGNAGNNTFIVTYTPSNTTNYNVVDNIEVTILVKYTYVITATNNQSSTYNGAVQKPVVTIKLGDEIVTDSYTLNYSVQPKNAGTYSIKISCTGEAGYDSDEISVTYTISKAKLTLTSTTVKVNYDSAKRDWTSVQGLIASKITYTGLFSGDTVTATIIGMHNGAYKYGTVSGSYETTNNTLFGTNYNYVVGSTYQAFISLSNANYELDGTDSILVKYKTALIGSTYYTIEDALATSGTDTITFAGDSSSATSYVATIFSSLPTSLTGYKTTYTLSNRTLLVPYTNSTSISFGQVNDVTVSSYNNYSVLIIPSAITLNVYDLCVNSEASGSTVIGNHGTIVNNGTINCSHYLYAYGYIKGIGSININNGATCKEGFRVYDYPGSADTAYNISKVAFPMCEWSLNSISCNLKIAKGASLLGYIIVYGTTVGYNEFTFDVIAKNSSTTNCLFAPASDASSSDFVLIRNSQSLNNCNSSITSNNQEAYKNMIDIILNGKYVDGTISISKSFLMGLININFSTTTSIPLPISYANIIIKSGSHLVLSKTSYVLLNGTKMEVEKGATLEINGNAFVALDTYENNVNVVANAVSAGHIINKQSSYLLLNGTLTGTGYFGGIIKVSEEDAVIQMNNNQIPANTIKTKKGTGAYTYSKPYAIQLIAYNGQTNQFNAEYENALSNYYMSTVINGKCGWLEKVSYISYNTYLSKKEIAMEKNGYTIESSDLPQIEKDYYTFGGWYIDSNCTTPALDYVIYSSTLLYAKWTPINYAINYVDVYDNGFANGNTSTSSNQTSFNYETNVSLVEATNGEYVFGGWYIDSICTDRINILNGQELVSKLSENSITVYALWYNTGTEKYVVTYNNSNANIPCVASDSIIDLENYNLPNMTVKDNDYTVTEYFGGWYKGTTLVTSLDSSLFTYNSSNNTYELTLDAKWVNKNELNVNVPGMPAIMTVYYKPGFKFTIPSLESKDITIGKNGLVLIDWKFDNEGSYKTGDTITLTTQTDLTANIAQFVFLSIGTNDYTTVTVTLTSGTGYTVDYNATTGVATATKFTGQTLTNGDTIYVTSGSTFKAKYTKKSGSDNGATITGTNPTTALGTTDTDYTVLTADIVITPAGTKSSICVMPDTLITLANGKKVAISSLTGNEKLLSWNETTNSFEEASILALWHHKNNLINVINLHFSNNKNVSIVEMHDFYDLGLSRFISISAKNYQDYINHEFYSLNGETITLESADVEIIIGDCYSLYTTNSNFITNDILSRTPDPFEGYFETIYNLESNEEYRNEMINTYGLFTFEEANGQVTEKTYEMFYVKYFKIFIGLGLIDESEVESILTLDDDIIYIA
ncbi:MAG: InlB B-repeat-containing protein [bacterium]|nr:InlB B-repeat-containing protein [bacterium]